MPFVHNHTMEEQTRHHNHAPFATYQHKRDRWRHQPCGLRQCPHQPCGPMNSQHTTYRAESMHAAILTLLYILLAAYTIICHLHIPAQVKVVNAPKHVVSGGLEPTVWSQTQATTSILSRNQPCGHLNQYFYSAYYS